MDPHVSQCDDCRARHGEYRRLVAALAGESPRSLPNQWKERTLARLEREVTRRRRRTSVVAGCCAAAAAAAVFSVLIIGPRHPPKPELAVRLEKGEGAYRGVGHPPG